MLPSLRFPATQQQTKDMEFLNKLGIGGGTSGANSRTDEAESMGLLSDWKEYNTTTAG